MLLYNYTCTASKWYCVTPLPLHQIWTNETVLQKMESMIGMKRSVFSSFAACPLHLPFNLLVHCVGVNSKSEVQLCVVLCCAVVSAYSVSCHTVMFAQ